MVDGWQDKFILKGKTMKKIIAVLLVFISIIGNSTNINSFIREVPAKNDGFASEEGGTTGGSKADRQNIFKVTNRKEFIEALGNKDNSEPKILMIYGTVDFNTDDTGKVLRMEDYSVEGYSLEKYLEAYSPEKWGSQKLTGELEEKRKASQINQKTQIQVSVPSNTSIIGIKNAKLKGVNLYIESDNVIIRNITFESPYDYFPGWDPKDGSNGNWNSEYDSISIKGGTHVWIDHCHFLDSNENIVKYFGQKYEHRDGLIDITNQANYITLSYNILENHDKTMLIGSSDSRIDDEGKLSVTIHHNYFYNLGQRVPRVRFGRVHIYNNYYREDGKNKNHEYSYSLGIGKNSKIYAENNVIEMKNEDYEKFVKIWGGKELTTVNNLFNDKKVEKFSDELSEVQWKPTLYTKIDDTGKVKKKVLKEAGTLKPGILK